MFRRILYVSLVLLWAGPPLLWGQVNHQVAFSTEYSVETIVLDDRATYTRVNMPGLQATDSIGYPALPVRYIKLIIPADSEAMDIVIRKHTKEKLKTDRPVEPVQPPVPTSIGYERQDFVKPDKAKYGSNRPYPAKSVEIVDQGCFRGNRIVTLAVYPFQYVPESNTLFFYPFIDFTLKHKPSKRSKRTRAKEDKHYQKVLKSIVDNKNDLKQFDIHAAANRSKTAGDVTEQPLAASVSGITVSCDYVVVTSEELAPEFNAFMAWKKRKGIDIELVTIEDIKANYTGDNISGINDDAGKLRQFLSDAYDNGLDFALLAGDHTVVPIRYGWRYNDDDSDDYVIPTDLYFAEFDGDWESDGDARYGETTDRVTVHPEIYVGRVMVSTADEIRNWTQKVLMYEQNPGNGDYTYLTKAFFTQADELQDGINGNYADQANYITNKVTWCTSDVFEEAGGGCTVNVPNFPKGSDVVTQFNAHYGLCSFMAHGGPTNVAVATKYYNSARNCIGQSIPSESESKYKVTAFDDGPGGCCWIAETGNGFDNFTNTAHPSIYYSISCTTMPFDDFGHTADVKNMGESYTATSNGGGPAYIGNTRNGFVNVSYRLFEDFLKVITDNTSFHIGVAVAISKQQYAYSRYINYSHNLLGCPETEIWTAVPSLFSSATVSENGSTVTVNTGGVSNAVICVMSALDNGSSYYEVRENVSFSTFTSVPKPYLVTITKHNYIPYLKNPDNIYIQNESIYSDRYIYGKYFYAGENVTTSKPQGPAKIKNGSNVVFDATNDVNLEGGFEVELGGEFEVK